MGFAVSLRNLTHRYGERVALDGISFGVQHSSFFGLIGPNGGGKSTIFKLISTLLTPQSGTITLNGLDVAKSSDEVRKQLGVVFQSPALDKKLSVEENLFHQGNLYGLSGKALRDRVQFLLQRFGLADRSKDRVEKLSGGLKRRIEIAKSLLHSPKVLLLDEPTTGLDPLARREVWSYLKELNRSEGLTVLLTTHLLDEAAQCASIVLLDKGHILCEGNPNSLVETLGGDVISMRTQNAASLASRIQAQFSIATVVVEDEVRVQIAAGHEFVPRLVGAFSDEIRSVTLGRPSLEDLFIERTGRRYGEEVSR